MTIILIGVAITFNDVVSKAYQCDWRGGREGAR